VVPAAERAGTAGVGLVGLVAFGLVCRGHGGISGQGAIARIRRLTGRGSVRGLVRARRGIAGVGSGFARARAAGGERGDQQGGEQGARHGHPPGFREETRTPGCPFRGSSQFLSWSTSLFLPIHGIIARSWLPTCSIGCAAAALRAALSSGWPARLSRTKFLTKRPDWMSASTRFISCLVSSVMIRGPVVMSPYSAVLEIE